MDPHLARLWRHRGLTLPTPRRGPRQQLDLDDILDTAIAIADTSGLDAVSTRAVAARFDKTAMALYPYVGDKENLLALMQDHAAPLPAPAPGDLRAWATALYEVYLAHPWLTERSWARSSQGPNEQDWMESLLGILDRLGVDPVMRAPAVTMLYATTRATAQTAAAYQHLTAADEEAWVARATAIPDFAERYPLSTALPPVTADWREAPFAGLMAAVDVLAAGLGLSPDDPRPGGSAARPGPQG
ncbi:TetR/AcrR family transcriptional regulator C-terminal domain-containing protein [Actinoplanes sp. LDG1-06]|uniref:TetR/AcrR family transcriptional regulator C-terminal domain-containing protein n=1 Tax=Paractinoplanes ovalisporus TaxID=2810368 RepID=A0ABS2ATJ1_9ACTN|nr:TetR/AcrR family transcriptional regulator [Actinoplanes ovalisporus]MBM2623139.1 TetR/AcrR family transcriptional regulator C-terminal domain-containing protein [Actinoplanes ovalisporus]